MGWWSTTVMGGDPPMDAEGDLFERVFRGTPYQDGCDRMDAQESGELTHEQVAAKIHEQLPELFEHISSILDEEYAAITKQVLGVLILTYGVPLSETTRHALNLATSGAGDDEWAYENNERAAHMKAFIAQLRQYNGQPTEVAFEGLFEKIFNEIAKRDQDD